MQSDVDVDELLPPPYVYVPLKNRTTRGGNASTNPSYVAISKYGSGGEGVDVLSVLPEAPEDCCGSLGESITLPLVQPTYFCDQEVVLAHDAITGVWGHWEASTGNLWPQCLHTPLCLKPSEITLFPGTQARATAIPTGVIIDQTSADVTLIDFAEHAAAAPFLFVEAESQVPCVEKAVADVLAQLDVATTVHVGMMVPAGWDAPSDKIILLTVSVHDPCGVVKTAHRLCANGLRVWPPMRPQHSGPPCIRLTTHVMTCLPTLSPKALQAFIPMQNTTVDGASTAVCLDACTDVLYGKAGDVPRHMLSWPAFAAWISPRIHTIDLKRINDLFQPLATYVGAFQRAFDVMARDVPHDTSASPCLSACKPTPSQTKHALQLFYWFAVHADEATAPCVPDEARRALVQYLRQGCVVLRKRTYSRAIASSSSASAVGIVEDKGIDDDNNDDVTRRRRVKPNDDDDDYDDNDDDDGDDCKPRKSMSRKKHCGEFMTV